MMQHQMILQNTVILKFLINNRVLLITRILEEENFQTVQNNECRLPRPALLFISRSDNVLQSVCPTKMAEHDLTSKLGNYLDRHLVFPLFEFLAVQGVSEFYYL